MSDLLAITASGVRATRGALDATAQNIANANTDGFVRRAPVLREVAGASMGYGPGVAAGVRLAGLARGSDEFRAADLRRADGDVARGAAQVAGLEAIEGALTSRAIGPALTGFFDAGLTLSADPTSTPGRTELLARADVVADAVRGAAADLANAGEDTRRSLELDAGSLTRSAAALARVNDQLLRTREGGTAAAALLDERDRLLGSMAGLAALDVRFGRHGMAEVSLAGQAEPALVTGTRSAELSVGYDATGRPGFALDGAAVTVAGGALAGRVDALASLSAAMVALDTLAADFAEGVNAVQADGSDADGQPGAPLFGGRDAATLTRTLTDPAGVAAAGPEGNAANLARLLDLRANVRPEGRAQALVTANATALAGRRQTGDALATVARAAESAWLEGAAVSLDQEAANLVRFQQAFQASGRVMQAATAMLDTILAIR